MIDALRRTPRGVVLRYLLRAGACLLVVVGCSELLRHLFDDPYPSERELAVEALGPETEILFLGNSVVEAAVDPRAFHRPVVCLPMANGNYLIDRAILARHLPDLPGLQAVVFQVDTTCLGWDRLTITRDFRVFRELEVDIWDLPMPWFRKLQQSILMSRWVEPLIFLPRLNPYTLVWNGRPQPPDPPRVAGFAPLYTELTAEARDQYFARSPPAESIRPDVLAMNRQALMSMVSAVLDHGAQPILLQYPQQGGYATFNSPEWRQAVAETLDAARLQFGDRVWIWNLEPELNLPLNHHRDTVHLNLRGAERFSRALDSRFESSLRGPEIKKPGPQGSRSMR